MNDIEKMWRKIVMNSCYFPLGTTHTRLFDAKLLNTYNGEFTMKLSQMVDSYTSNPRMQAKLLIGLKLSDGGKFRKGTRSDMLIDKGNGKYHFEKGNHACVVTRDEIEFI